VRNGFKICNDSLYFPAGIGWPAKLFESPPSLINYDFTVPPKVNGHVVSADLCYAQPIVTGALCGLTTFLQCLNEGYHRDQTGNAGMVPFELFGTIIGHATATVGKFAIGASDPLKIRRERLPMLMRSPCGGANTTGVC